MCWRRSRVSAFLMGRESSCWYCALSRGSSRGKMVLCNATLPVQPSGPALILGGCRVGSGELRPCSLSSCGCIHWAVGAWLVFIVVEGAVFLFG